MALDSRAKRMSAIFIGKPFRGPMVYAPDSGFNQGERQAAAFMYSGIAAGLPIGLRFWKLATRRAGTTPENRGNRAASVAEFADHTLDTTFVEDHVSVDDDL